ncbi:hypothetical protein [Aestuariibius sp. HNIBRBA575]|uniref:ABC transporter permease subunit n=1 Tax=Aestuariibius sp. HNIBRBA575 TaxID=3233343 RepID=UPI0034A28347
MTLAIWALAGALGGLGGMAIGMSATVFPSVGANLLLIIGAAVLLGGLGSPVGAVSGALTVGIAAELSTLWITPSLKPAVAFAMIALVLLVRPGGLTNQKVVFKHD